MRFIGNPLLSDITLTKAAAPDAEPIKAHKVVLAASSGLFFDLFTKENQELVHNFKIPVPIPTKAALIDDPYKLAITYMYTFGGEAITSGANKQTQPALYLNHLFMRIKDSLSPNNVFQLYSVAYTLRIKCLIEDLETFIVNELLDRDNWINFYLDGIRFKSDRVTNACEKVLINDFQNVWMLKGRAFSF